MRPALRALVLTLAMAAGAAHAAGYAELAAAIRAGDAAQVQALLAQGVDASATDGKGAAPVLVAASRGKHDITRQLIARGADLNVRYAAYYDATPLMLAVNNRDGEMVRLLLEAGAQVDLVDSNGDPALNWACFHGDLGIVDQLLRHRANVQLVGHGTALEVSMRRGHQPLVERLLDHLGQRRTLAGTELALQRAVDAGDADAVRAALRSGAVADGGDDTGRSLLARAARQGRSDVVAMLLAAGAKADAADAIGFTPLFEAARDGHLAVVRELLDRGADANRVALRNGLGMTPLHAAAGSGRSEIVALLVARGARVDARDIEQATALSWAINNDMPTALRLVALGADPDLAPQGGSSPRQLARQRDLKDLLAAMDKRRPG